jgi:Mg2+-importing ATPase
VLVIFVIRTRGRPWRSRPHRWLAATALAAVGVAVLLPFTPLAGVLGFVAPPPELLLLIAALTLVYLSCAELAKRWFYRAVAHRRAHPRRG